MSMITLLMNITTINHSALFRASWSNRRDEEEGRVTNILGLRQYIFEEIQIELL